MPVMHAARTAARPAHLVRTLMANELRCTAIVVPEQPAETLAARNGAGGNDFILRVDQAIAKALVVPFVAIELQKLVDRPAK